MIRFAAAARLALVIGAATFALASASSNQQPQQTMIGGPNDSAAFANPPPPQAMELPRSLGLWKSSFGAVKIEEDLTRGGPGNGVLQGVWIYQRDGRDVIGYFAGTLNGNVYQFNWQEPPVSAGAPTLTGSGFLVFEPMGRTFGGRWWTANRDRVGDWSGWRPEAATTPAAPPAGNGGSFGGAGYGGATYGGVIQPSF